MTHIVCLICHRQSYSLCCTNQIEIIYAFCQQCLLNYPITGIQYCPICQQNISTIMLNNKLQLMSREPQTQNQTLIQQNRYNSRINEMNPPHFLNKRSNYSQLPLMIQNNSSINQNHNNNYNNHQVQFNNSVIQRQEKMKNQPIQNINYQPVGPKEIILSIAQINAANRSLEIPINPKNRILRDRPNQHDGTKPYNSSNYQSKEEGQTSTLFDLHL